MDNVKASLTFTGTEDESWFYMISVAMEATAGRSIPAMVRALEAARVRDYALVSQALEELTICIEGIGALLERMYEKCGTSAFFHQIRPFLAGSKNMAEAGLPNGVFYDEGDGKGAWMQLRGGSNGQSSMIQFLDLMLGVTHTSRGNANPHPTATQSPRKPQPGFHEEVRDYMPGPHRRFLEYIKQLSQLREIATAGEDDAAHKELCERYSAAAEALTEFRNKHLQIVTRYIVLPSAKAKAANCSKQQNLATASAGHGTNSQELTGTGGTLLIPFLKQTRDETSEAAVLR